MVQKMLLQDASGESSPMRMLQKLTDLTRVCCEVLQLWQARRMAPMEVQKVLENIDQCWQAGLSEPSNGTRSSNVTEIRATHRGQSQGLLLMGLCTEAREAISQEHSSVILEANSKYQFLYHFIG